MSAEDRRPSQSGVARLGLGNVTDPSVRIPDALERVFRDASEGHHVRLATLSYRHSQGLLLWRQLPSGEFLIRKADRRLARFVRCGQIDDHQYTIRNRIAHFGEVNVTDSPVFVNHGSIQVPPGGTLEIAEIVTTSIGPDQEPVGGSLIIGGSAITRLVADASEGFTGSSFLDANGQAYRRHLRPM